MYHMTVSAEEIRAARAATGKSYRALARDLGTSHATVQRACALSRTRKADEFTKAKAIAAPTRQQPLNCWSLESIRAARDAQLRGDFKLPVRLAEAMRTDYSLFTAYHGRLAPQASVQTKLVPCKGARGKATARRALDSAIAERTVLASILGSLANHGIAIGIVRQTPNDSGTRIDFRLEEWPIEHVKWNASSEVLETAVKGGLRVPIVHGDGTWIVFRKFSILPWTQEACVLPGALLWAMLANGIRDWASASTSHGQAKIMGELPEGVSLQSAENTLTPEAAAFLDMLQSVVSGESGAGIRPAGAKTDFLANGSTAWQVFKELIQSGEKGAARIYLGTDATLGSVGGAPGVDIATLFGVATTKVQGDFQAIEQALDTGFYQPWAAVNDGDSRYSPRLVYQLPDADEEGKRAEHEKNRARLFDALDRMRANQMVIDQPTVDALALEFAVTPVPQLAPAAAAGGTATPPAPLVRASALAGSFDETKHPRADDGEFGAGTGAGPSEKPKPKSKKEQKDADNRKKVEQLVPNFGALGAPWEPQRAAEVARAYEGLTPEQVNQVARGERATANTFGKPGRERTMPPVRVHVEVKPGETKGNASVVDGNHRLAGARAAGATEILAEVTVEETGPGGKTKRSVYRGPVSL